MKKRKSIITIIALFLLIIAIVVGIVFLIKDVILPKFAKSAEEEIPEALAKLYDNGDYISKIDKDLYSQIKSVKENYGIYAYDIENKEIKDVFRTQDDFKTKKFNNSYDYYLVKMTLDDDYSRFDIGYDYNDYGNIKLQIYATCVAEITDIQTFLNEYIEKRFINVEVNSTLTGDIVNPLSTAISNLFWQDLDVREKLTTKGNVLSDEITETITANVNTEILNKPINGITIKSFYVSTIVVANEDYNIF